jgi:hypothetical protein
LKLVAGGTRDALADSDLSRWVSRNALISLRHGRREVLVSIMSAPAAGSPHGMSRSHPGRVRLSNWCTPLDVWSRTLSTVLRLVEFETLDHGAHRAGIKRMAMRRSECPGNCYCPRGVDKNEFHGLIFKAHTQSAGFPDNMPLAEVLFQTCKKFSNAGG